MTDADYAHFGAVLKESLIIWDGDYVSISLNDMKVLEEVVEYIRLLGYARPIDVSGTTVSVSNLQSEWSENRALYFYKDKKSFWSDYKELGEERYFYITYCHSTNLMSGSDDFSLALSCFANWNRLLVRLSDHIGTISSPETLVFFVGSDKGAKKYKVNPRLSLEQLLAKGTRSSNQTAIKLLSILDIADAQDTERREIMRVALVDFLEDLEVLDKEYFCQCLSSHESLLGKYLESFETLIHRNSINKALEEVAEKNIEYVNKLNDAISSAQTKAFAIPGAIIAIGALVRSFGFAEALLVFFGLWMVKKITKGTNEIQLDVLDNLRYQVREIFTRYKKASDEAIVKRKAEEAMLSILVMTQKAIDRINGIDRLSNLMLLATLTYFLLRAVMPGVVEWINGLCFYDCHPIQRSFALN